MKATIHGIQIEGTPQEIAEYVRLQSEQSAAKLCNWPPEQPPYYTLLPKITCGTTETGGWMTVTSVNKGKCPNEGKPCFCTGECHEKVYGSFSGTNKYTEK